MVYDGDGSAHRLGRQCVTEDLAEQVVHDWVETLFDEAVAILLRFPDVEVAQPTCSADSD